MEAILDYLDIIVLCVLCVVALIGLIVGLCKGFMEMSSWANEFVIATVGASLIGMYAGDLLAGFFDWLPTVAVIGGGIVIMLVFMAISAAFRKGFARGISKHRRKLKYKNLEAVQESDADIVDALSRKDFKAYRRISRFQRRKFKQHRGGWGFCDRIFGAITGAVKYFTVVALIVIGCLIVLDVTGVAVAVEEGETAVAITEQYLYSIFQSDLWITVQPYLLDFALIGAICASLRAGYKSGLFSGLWTLVAIFLVVFGFYLAWIIVADSGTFDGMIAGLANGMLAKLGDMGPMISQIIIAIGLGVIFAIVIILLAIFIPKAIDAARETKVFHFVDGILGAIVIMAIVVGILMFMFGLLSTLSGLQHEPEIFVKIGTYFQGGVSRYFYSENFLTTFEWFPNLAEYFG